MSSVNIPLQDMNTIPKQEFLHHTGTSFVDADPEKMNLLQAVSSIPLPEGWEAKYNVQYGKWYYINHRTKLTQWEDPRIQQAISSQQNAYDSFRSTSSQRSTTGTPSKDFRSMLQNSEEIADSARESLQKLRDRLNIPQQSLHMTPSDSFRKKENIQLSDLKINDGDEFEKAKRELKIRYPFMDETTISLALKVAKNDIEMASKVLKAKQIKDHSAKTGAAATSNVTFAKKSEEFRPLPKVDNEAEAKRELSKRFPLMDNTAIFLALKMTENDVEMASKILQAKKEQDRDNLSKLSLPATKQETTFGSIATTTRDVSFHTAVGQPSTMKVEPKQAYFNLLRSQYPNAPDDVIRGQLISTKNHIQGSRLGLEAMGYQKGKPTEKKPSEKKKEKPQSVKKEVSQKALSELKKKLPTHDDIDLRVALKVAKNDVALAEKILQRKKEKDDKKQENVVSTTKPTKDPARTLAPVVFGVENVTTSKASDGKPAVYTQVLPKSIRSKTRQRPKVQSKTAAQQDLRKPPVYNYTSSLRIKPMGPNPDLCKGPDSNLLLKTYAERMGPNKANRKGPMRSNRCGPDPRNRVGSANLAIGPAAMQTTMLKA